MKFCLKLLISIVFVCFLFYVLIQFDLQEVDIHGWERYVNRNLNNYIHTDEFTATIIPQNFCDAPAFIVIICISSPTGFQARKTIRNTWGKEKIILGQNVSLYFLLGQTPHSTIQEQINEESAIYEDLIQEKFMDTYNNLTIKSAMMLKIFKMNCYNTATFLLKIDQDIYLNLPKLVNELLKNKKENLLMGAKICGAKPIKDYKNKWYAGPNYLYHSDIYPHYLSGTSYCMSANVAIKLLDAAISTEIFHLEDVYFTGICANKLGLNITHSNFFTYGHLELNYCLYRELITIHYQDPNSMEQTHLNINDIKLNKHCQEKDQMFFVRQWIFNHVLELNRTMKRRQCSN